MKALKFDNDGPKIQYKDCENHFHLFFNLTLAQEANVEMQFSDVVGAGMRLALNFANTVAITVEIFVSGERISSIAIDMEGSVSKMDNQQLLHVVNKFPHLKFKYIGSHPADL